MEKKDNLSAIISGSINLNAIDKQRLKEANGKTFLNFSAFVKNESKYGNNIMIVESVSKEENEAGIKGAVLGNAGVRYINPNIPIVKAEKDNEVTNTVQNEAREVDLPF